ncbi:MAG: HEAT repeat domain-containing protein [Planctomycetota bacterium]
MRLAPALCLAAFAVASAAASAGCETAKPGPEPRPPTSAELRAQAEQWVNELALEGVREENQRGRTIYLLKRLIESRPQSTQAVLAVGVTHPDPKVRENCAFFLNYAEDRAAAEALMKLLEDDQEAVRFSAAASLATGHAEPAGVPLLLKGLRHEKLAYRQEAVKALRMFSGRYYGYDPKGDPDVREFAAKKWDEWFRTK